MTEGIKIKSSNSLNDLAATLATNIRESNFGVFQPVYIVTQTGGMNAWLKQKIAGAIGIASNIRFISPNELIFKVYQLSGGKFRQSLEAGHLVWLIYKILGEQEFCDRFRKISAYYLQPVNDVKRMSLAEKIADLFDQYQVYRPEMIEQWNAGKPYINKEDEYWQMYIWERARREVGDSMPDKTVMGRHIRQALEDAGAVEKVTARMPVIYLFGISLITKYHYGLLELIAGKIPVNFYILNPAPNIYWYEDLTEKAMAYLKGKGILPASEKSVANPLLTHWGRVIQNTFRLLFESEKAINDYEVISDNIIEADSLLHKLQKAICENTPQIQGGVTPADLLDGSLTIHSCHNPFREVQVLYNHLVHLIDGRREKLSPRDIVVVVSDIELYAPYIRAVFNHAPYPFKYRIADEPYTVTDSVFNAMISILELNAHNLTGENVYRLCDFTCIRNRFGITNLDLIRRIIDESNIRFGIDGSADDDTRYVSWEYGLQRVMYGICMSGGEEFGEGADSFYPIDFLEGDDAREAIRFVHFALALIGSIKSRKTHRTVQDWANYLQEVYVNFLLIPDFAGENEALLVEKIQQLNRVDEFFEETLSYDVFSRQFLPALTHSVQTELFAGGGITFCSPIPMRSIPFKVVAMLGMDFDKLPRKNRPVSFDLMEQDKKRGDRNIKENDKHLFLETLLSAQKYFYISYCGQSAKDNSSLPASILVDELIGYIGKYADDGVDVAKELIIRHPLHDFSTRYNRERGLISYTNMHSVHTDRAAAFAVDNHVSNEEPGGEREQEAAVAENSTAPLQLPRVGLRKFIDFFKDPCKFYYNSALEIYYHENEVTLPETEIFSLDNLGLHRLKSDLLQLTPADIEGYVEREIKTGNLPLKNMARVITENADAEIAKVRELWQELTEGDERELTEVVCALENIDLEARFEVYGNKLLEVCFSKNETKYLFAAYVKHLVNCALALGLESYFISCSKGESFKAIPVSTHEAKKRLQALANIFVRGQQEIIPFFMELCKDEKKWGTFDAAGLEKILGNERNHRSPYLQKEYEHGFFDAEGVYDDFNEIAQIVLFPLKEFLDGYFKG